MKWTMVNKVVNYIPCSQCDHRYSNVDWYVKRPLELPHGKEWEIWCMVCYAKEMYYNFLADDEWRRDKG